MIVVHHLNSSRSHRIIWLLEELSLPYEIVRYHRDASTMLAPEQLKKIHPLGKAPVLSDDGMVIAESGAIIEYLVEKYDAGCRLQPALGTRERLGYRYWLHYAEGSLMPYLVMSLVFSRIPKSPMPFFVRPVAQGICRKVRDSFLAPQIGNHLDFIEDHLSRSRWFAGSEFSAADIQMSFPLEAAMTRQAGDYPRVSGFLQDIHARPAYKRAVERAGALTILG